MGKLCASPGVTRSGDSAPFVPCSTGSSLHRPRVHTLSNQATRNTEGRTHDNERRPGVR